ncbi:homocitrate synthase [Candidatus Sumerlaeota bacterium]|nr:homocitrate synthase [Candidatus Sumerlaeota bacterium]
MKEFKIVDSTLREGEQFAGARFTTKDKIKIAKALDAFGVEYIELSSPMSSPISFQDHIILVDLGLKATLVPHLRCAREDIDKALATGVKSINMMFATSPVLQQYSHGKNMDYIVRQAADMTKYIKDKGLEVRFSGEDAFRSNLEDLDRVFAAVIEAGADRIGIPDTVGRSTPFEVYEVFRHFREIFPNVDIEFHCHNDTGCAVANAWAALEAGCTHIDVTVLGIGERNGITPLGGLIARMYAIDKGLVKKYKLKKLRELDELVAKMVGFPIPFNNYITSPTAFHHRAGIHTNALLKSASSYEIFDLDDFGVTRKIDVAHRLIGKNAIKARAAQLKLDLDEAELHEITWEIKTMSDQELLTDDYVDNLLTEAAQKNGRNPNLPVK